MAKLVWVAEIRPHIGTQGADIPFDRGKATIGRFGEGFEFCDARFHTTLYAPTGVAGPRNS